MFRHCDGQDPELIKMRDIDMIPTDEPEFAVSEEPCACGARFEDKFHDLVWPHGYKEPPTPVRVVTDIPDLYGML